MNMYKSLVFREWKLSKKHYILRTVIFALLSTLFLLTTYSMGKEADQGKSSVDGFLFIMAYFIGIVAAVIVAEDNGVYKADVKSGWLNYSWTLPITAFEKAMSKYIFKGGLVSVGMITTVMVIAGMYALCGGNFNIQSTYLFFIVVDAVLLYDLVRQIIIMHAVDVKSLKKMGNIAGIILAVIFFLPEILSDSKSDPVGELFASMDPNAGEEAVFEVFDKLMDLIVIPNYIGIIAILLMVVILVISFVVTWKGYERRRV